MTQRTKLQPIRRRQTGRPAAGAALRGLALVLALYGCGGPDKPPAGNGKGGNRPAQQGKRGGEPMSPKARGRLPGSVVPIEVVAETPTTRTLRHACGTTQIPAQPQRIVAIGVSDPMIFLGREPVADSNWGSIRGHYLDPFRTGEIHRIGGVYGQSMPNAEAVMVFKPDLILLETPNQQSYEQMALVAPTVAVTSMSAERPQQALDIGRVLGMEERAERAVAWYERKAALAAKALRDGSGGPKIGVMWFAVKQIRLYYSTALYEDLGLDPPEMVASGARMSWRWRRYVMGLEELGDYKADHLFVINPDGASRNVSLDLLKSLTLSHRVPAIRDNHIYPAEMSCWICGGITGHSMIISQVLQSVLPPEKLPDELKPYLKARPTDEDLDGSHG